MNQPVAVPEVMSADLPAGAFLLDVREDDEWTAGHAPEAVHVRLGELGARLGELPRDCELYVICRSGNRSAYVAEALAFRGLNTINVSDGMTGWAVAGRPMVSEDGTEPHVALRHAAVITSSTALAAMPGNVFLPAAVSGLPKDSVINVTALVTLDKTDLDEPVGHLPAALMSEVDRGLRRVLGT